MNHRESNIIKNVQHVCKELTIALSMEIEQLQHEADYSLPCSAKAVKESSYTFTPPYTLMVCTGTSLYVVISIKTLCFLI